MFDVLGLANRSQIGNFQQLDTANLKRKKINPALAGFNFLSGRSWHHEDGFGLPNWLFMDKGAGITLGYWVWVSKDFGLWISVDLDLLNRV